MTETDDEIDTDEDEDFTAILSLSRMWSLLSAEDQHTVKRCYHRVLIQDDHNKLQRLLHCGLSANMEFEIDQIFEVFLENLDSIHADDPEIYNLCSALQVAVSSASKNCVQLLLKYGADVNWNQPYAILSRACMYGNHYCQIVQQLVEHGAGINVNHPLLDCVGSDCVDCVKLLLSFGSSPNQSMPALGGALHLAVVTQNQSNVDMTRTLLQYGSDVNLRNADGDTPVFIAAICGHDTILRLLLESGASVNIVNKENQTALHRALQCSMVGCVHTLVLNMDDLNTIDSTNSTALDYALKKCLSFKLSHNGHSYSSPETTVNPVPYIRHMINHGACSNRFTSSDVVTLLENSHHTKELIGAVVNTHQTWNVDLSHVTIPEENMHKDRGFYQRLLKLCGTPRSLQHQCRCALRTHLQTKFASVIEALNIPQQLRPYLLLDDPCDFQ